MRPPRSRAGSLRCPFCASRRSPSASFRDWSSIHWKKGQKLEKGAPYSQLIAVFWGGLYVPTAPASALLDDYTFLLLSVYTVINETKLKYSHLSLDIGFEDFFRGQPSTSQPSGCHRGRGGVELPVPVEVGHPALEDRGDKGGFGYGLPVGRGPVQVEGIDFATVTWKVSPATGTTS